MEDCVTMHTSSSKGFSLVETVIAIGVLTTGVLGTAAVLVTGMKNLSSSPADVVMTQKAVQAIESVFSARDSGKLTWNQIRNDTNGGVFDDVALPVKFVGLDGLVNTADDGPGIETTSLPGPDQTLGTSDDTTITLTGYTRQITITEVPDMNGELRKVVVTVLYASGTIRRKFELTTFISAYS
jgi:type II secretory pathway pseudopilin PulG